MVVVLGEELHGRHVGALRERHQRIDWRPEVPRADRIRVKEHTCCCKATFYELCQAGGLMFVRRTHRLGDTVVVHESPWVRVKEAEELWFLLLMGSAR